jgi:hypothetical protein
VSSCSTQPAEYLFLIQSILNLLVILRKIVIVLLLFQVFCNHFLLVEGKLLIWESGDVQEVCGSLGCEIKKHIAVALCQTWQWKQQIREAVQQKNYILCFGFHSSQAGWL